MGRKDMISVPEGWVLVPKEPTLEMVMAGEDAWDKQVMLRLDPDNRAPYPSEEKAELCSRASYKAMLARAPAFTGERAMDKPITEAVHTCSYYCERPECIRAQRDELVSKLTAQQPEARGEVVAALAAEGVQCETCDDSRAVVTYVDPYERGDVSSPEQSPCPDCAEGHVHPHVKSSSCHCIQCRPLERPCDCRGCRDLAQPPSVPVGVPDSVIVLLNHLEILMDKGELEEDAIPTDMWNAVTMHNFALAQQPAPAPSAPVGVEGLVREYRQSMDVEVLHAWAQDIVRALAQQPTGGAS